MILIKNATLVDGTGARPERKDILVKDDRVAAIGTFPNKDADIVIDGEGMIATPGFIDVNTDSDHYLSLFTDPSQQDFLLQGVTTIIGGQCGSSLAPLLNGRLDSIRKWGDTNQVNINWATLSEFLYALKSVKLGVNFGTLVGHSTVRRALLGEQVRDLTEAELKAMRGVVEQAMKEGALGLSTGLGYNHAHDVPYIEIKQLADIVARYGGVYATHLRDEGEHLLGSVDETIRLANEAKVKTIISHFRPIIGYEADYEHAKEAIEKNSNGLVHFDLYPFRYSILPIYMLLPASHREGNLEHMFEQFSSHHSVEEIKKSFSRMSGKGMTIARAPGFDFLVGKTVAKFSADRGITAAQGIFELMRMTKLRAVLFNENVSEAVGLNALMSDVALVASNSPSLVAGQNVLENERAAKTFKKFIRIALDKGKPIEWVIHKITEKPARLLGLEGRGVIKEGAIADIALLRGEQAMHVLVGGAYAVKNGALNEEVRAGVILARR